MRKKRSGYLIGVIVSSLAAVLTTVVAMFYLQARLVRCWMSLGCSDVDNSRIGTVLLLMLGAYLFVAAVVAFLAYRIFDCRGLVAFLLNVAPLVVIISGLFLLSAYREYAYRTDLNRALKTAISDAPAIHLGEPFVKAVDDPGGGVTLFVHVPFTVERIVQARSLNILATRGDLAPNARYAASAECNSVSSTPPYGFHIVDHEYSEPPLPSYVTGTKIVSKDLAPGRQYYLLRELHFGYSKCRTSDYEDFDPKQLNVTLDVAYAKRRLEHR
jgi:hypothetical protein